MLCVNMVLKLFFIFKYELFMNRYQILGGVAPYDFPQTELTFIIWQSHEGLQGSSLWCHFLLFLADKHFSNMNTQ